MPWVRGMDRACDGEMEGAKDRLKDRLSKVCLEAIVQSSVTRAEHRREVGTQEMFWE